MSVSSNIRCMSKFSDLLNAHLERIGANPYKLVQWSGASPNGLSEQYLYKLCRGEATPKAETMSRLASVPELGLTLDTLKAWRALDEYKPEEIVQAFELLGQLGHSKIETTMGYVMTDQRVAMESLKRL